MVCHHSGYLAEAFKGSDFEPLSLPWLPDSKSLKSAIAKGHDTYKQTYSSLGWLRDTVFLNRILSRYR